MELAAEVYVGVAENTEVTSPEPQLIWVELRLGGVVTDDVTDDEEKGRLQAEGGGAPTLTSPVNRLRRGSAHRLPLEAGSKVKRPL